MYLFPGLLRLIVFRDFSSHTNQSKHFHPFAHTQTHTQANTDKQISKPLELSELPKDTSTSDRRKTGSKPTTFRLQDDDSSH